MFRFDGKKVDKGLIRYKLFVLESKVPDEGLIVYWDFLVPCQ